MAPAQPNSTSLPIPCTIHDPTLECRSALAVVETADCGTQSSLTACVRQLCAATDMSFLVFLRSKLLPEPHKISRDIGLYTLLAGVASTATIACAGSVLVGYGTTEKHMLGGREQTTLQGYRAFFSLLCVIMTLSPLAAHLATRCFPPSIHRKLRVSSTQLV
eukprot:5903469-Prymnesium_polylepis.1